jgi:hypothetical protein
LRRNPQIAATASNVYGSSPKIVLGAPVNTTDGKLAFSPEDQAKIADAEARTAAIMERRLDAKAGTQNIDRILRLPGTINLPNVKKAKDGRVPCPTGLIRFNGASYDLRAFPLPEPTGPGTPDDGGHHARQQDAEEDEWDKLEETIKHCDVPVGKRSERVWYVINEMLRRGYVDKVIAATLLNRKNKISAHIYDQTDPHGYVRRQIADARRKLRFLWTMAFLIRRRTTSVSH